MIWNFTISLQNKTDSNKGISNVGGIIQYPYMRQRIKQWIQCNLWNTAFKKIEVIWSALTDHKYYLVHS